MKTSYSPEQVTAFLGTLEHALPESLEPLTEGHISQAFSYHTSLGDKRVLRISSNEPDFLADKYAAEYFGPALHVPSVLAIEAYNTNDYYCITQFVEGKTANVLTDDELIIALPAIRKALADIYTYDISSRHGFGSIDTSTGNAPYRSWQAALGDEIEKLGIGLFRENAANIGLDPNIANQFFQQFRDNRSFASEVRRLIHGDPAFDNMLVDGADVTAIIDWAQMGYGDWMSDFARLEFWWPDRYGNEQTFAKQYGLDDDNLKERKALYWATNAL